MAWPRVCGWHYRIRIKSSLSLAAPDGQRLCKKGERERGQGYLLMVALLPLADEG